ncbi:LysR family transcriptional regulator [Streptomyces sp. NPDC005538]|uniref:LysR family transcriptional regulator n=1 Tax=unclassified Streptomyces TaxID=2593676 RepID=UPI0033B0013B
MELQRLRAFREVARELSFTRAAQNLHYSQPSVTAQIKSLEETVGAPLFVRRGNRSVELTPAGARLLPYADRILELVEAAHLEIHLEIHSELPTGLHGAAANSRLLTRH